MTKPQSDVRALALSVTKKHGLLKCRECATELRQVLLGAGKKGHVLKLTALRANPKRNFVMMKDPAFKFPFAAPGNPSISNTGLHFGVFVDGFVFDNIHREGIARADWVDTFDCYSQCFDIEECEHF
jgi:hypothetical protein